MNNSISVVEPPALDELSGGWCSGETLAHYPTVHNFHGCLQVNKDLLSVSWLVNVPYSQGMHSGALYIDDRVLLADEFKWSPYQALRRTKYGKIHIETSVRMPAEDSGVLFDIRIKNSSKKSKKIRVGSDLVGCISKFNSPLDWDWFYRLPGYPEDNGSRSTAWNAILDTEKCRDNITEKPELNSLFKTDIKSNKFISSDTNTPAVTCFAFAQKDVKITSVDGIGHAEWSVKLKPGQETHLSYVMAYGGNKKKVIKKAVEWAAEFSKYFNKAKQQWQKRFDQAFTPGNKHFSGCLPILETDDIKLKRNYYIAIVTLLMLERTNLPVMDRVYLTGSPRLGASIMFCWDTSMWSTVFALLDPVIMKKFIKNMLQLDIDSYFGQDMLGARGVGNMYSATRMNIFRLIYTYLSVTGDIDFLEDKVFSPASGTYAEMHGDDAVCLDANVGEISILEELENIATAWKKQVRENNELADYGEALNLLECVPTYIHCVPSFNAANVWMMRLTGKLYQLKGNTAKADMLKKEAEKLSKAVLGLYRKGEGVWSSLHRDGKKIEMRHCYDYIALGKFMNDDLSDDMKKEMTSFVENELLTKSWMRAQSLKDPASHCSDRADHGPMGAYDGWPAQTADVMGIFGYWEKAVNYFRSCEEVTNEGNFSQARELYGTDKENFNAEVRIADRDLVNRECSGGVAFANTVLQYFFGINPDIENDSKLLFRPEENRFFKGVLHNLHYRNKYYKVISDKNGLSLK